LGLQDQDLEHQHVVEWRAPALGAIRPRHRPRHRPLELEPEQLEVDHGTQPFEAVAFGRQHGQPLLEIEEPRLTAHPILPLLGATNQIRPEKARFLEVSSCL
jgi:hypothetical protein